MSLSIFPTGARAGTRAGSHRARWTILCAAVLLAATFQSQAAGTHIVVTEAWIRWLPGDVPAGGYLTLRNDGDQAAQLTGVSSPAYGMVMLHRTRMQGGVSHMDPVSEITVAAHQTLRFAASGYHIMLEQPRQAVHPGDHVPVTLRFADGSTIEANCEVRGPTANNGS